MQGLIGIAEAATKLGIHDTGHGRANRRVMTVLRAVEKSTGRKLLIAAGEGNGARYLVVEAELDAVLSGHLSSCPGVPPSVGSQRDKPESATVRLPKGLLDAATAEAANLSGVLGVTVRPAQVLAAWAEAGRKRPI